MNVEAWWIRVRLLTIGAVLTNVLPLSAAGPGAVAFTKDGQVYIANENGSEERRISAGATRKAMPKWSPDGQLVLYLDTSTLPSSLGTLVVVDKAGTVRSTHPILRIAPDGAKIDGMRFVEQVGWMDRTHVFAVGSINPHASEYRVFDVKSGKVEGFGGTNFATCPRKGLVAFWLPVFPPSTAMTLQISASKKPIFTFPDQNALPEINVQPAWDGKCEVLGFVDPRPPAHFLLATPDGVHKRVPIRDGQSNGTSLVGIAGGFLVGSKKALFYNFETSRLVSTPAEVLDKLAERDLSRQRVATALGATDADWWEGEGR